MPFNLLKRRSKYSVTNKSMWIAKVQLPEKAVLECSLNFDTTAQECLDIVAQRFELVETMYFGLKYTNKKLKMRWTVLDKPLKRQLDKNASSALLHFDVMHFTPNYRKLHQDVTRLLYYFAIRKRITDGLIAIDDHTQASTLVSYALQADYGDCHQISLTHDDLESLSHLLPPKYGNFESVCYNAWQLYYSHQGLSESASILGYIECAVGIKDYGIEWYYCKIPDGPGDVLLGLSWAGVTIRSDNDSHYRWIEIKHMFHDKRHFSMVTMEQRSTHSYLFDDVEAAKYVWRMAISQHRFYLLNQQASKSLSTSNIKFGDDASSKRSNFLSIQNLNTDSELFELHRELASSKSNSALTDFILNHSRDAANGTHHKYPPRQYSRGSTSGGGDYTGSTPSLTNSYQSQPTALYPAYDARLIDRTGLPYIPSHLVCSQPDISSRQYHLDLLAYNMQPELQMNVSNVHNCFSMAPVSQKHLDRSHRIRMNRDHSIQHCLSSPNLTYLKANMLKNLIGPEYTPGNDPPNTAPPPPYPGRQYTSTPDLVSEVVEAERGAVAQKPVKAPKIIGALVPPRVNIVKRSQSEPKPPVQEMRARLQHLGTIVADSHQLIHKKHSTRPLERRISVPTTSQPTIVEESDTETSKKASKSPSRDYGNTDFYSANRPESSVHRLTLSPIESAPSGTEEETDNDIHSESTFISTKLENDDRYATHGGLIPATVSNISLPEHPTLEQRNSEIHNFVKSNYFGSNSPTKEVVTGHRTPNYKGVSLQHSPGNQEILTPFYNEPEVGTSRKLPVDERVSHWRDRVHQGGNHSLKVKDGIKPVLFSTAHRPLKIAKSAPTDFRPRPSHVSVTHKFPEFSTFTGFDISRSELHRATRSDDLTVRSESGVGGGTATGDAFAKTASAIFKQSPVEKVTMRVRSKNGESYLRKKANRMSATTRAWEEILLTLTYQVKNTEALFTEYESIPKVKQNVSFSFGLADQNVKRNRYKEILPYDDTRVKLTASKQNVDGYTNANHVQVTVATLAYNYIASQAPKHNTCGEFWQMVWEQEVTVIAMLVHCQEDGCERSFQYWPVTRGSVVTYSGYSVTCQRVTQARSYTLTYLMLERRKVRRHMYHLHYTDWPTNGKNPGNIDGFLACLDQLNCLRKVVLPPQLPVIVVHCSAGVGRTGVFILAELMIASFEQSCCIRIVDMLRDIRMQRMNLVQSLSQYEFVYTVLIEFLGLSRLI